VGGGRRGRRKDRPNLARGEAWLALALAISKVAPLVSTYDRSIRIRRTPGYRRLIRKCAPLRPGRT
jgi:hypothetical protein